MNRLTRLWCPNSTELGGRWILERLAGRKRRPLSPSSERSLIGADAKDREHENRGQLARMRLAATSEPPSARSNRCLRISVGVGLALVGEIFEEEIGQVVGPRGKHDPERQAYRHCRERRQLTLGDRRVEVAKPQARTKAGEEVELDSYRFFASRDLLTEAARVAAAQVNRPLGHLPPFVAGTSRKLAELMGRDLRKLDLLALFIDGIETAEGSAHLHRSHTRQGLARGRPRARRTGAAGDRQAAPRRSSRRRRQPPRGPRGDPDRNPARAQLEPAAHLQVDQPMESMIPVARTVTGDVKRWRDGGMILRWTAAGVLEAQKQFRRVNGYRDLQLLCISLQATKPPGAVATVA